MYAYIEGTIDEITDGHLILDHDGIGYELLMSQTDLSRLSGRRERLRIYTYYQSSENGVALYGFLSKESRELFLMLITVNGVGPKAAVAILGTLSAEELRFAIIGEDVKAISAAPGIGPKTAKRIILDLKDRIDFVEAVDSHLDTGVHAAEPSAKSDAMAALAALGFSGSEVVRVFSDMEIAEDAAAEELIRLALARLQ